MLTLDPLGRVAFSNVAATARGRSRLTVIEKRLRLTHYPKERPTAKAKRKIVTCR